MAFPYDEHLGEYTAGDWIKGVSTILSRCTSVTNAGQEGTLSGLLTEATHLNMICISEIAGTVIKAIEIRSTETFEYALLDGATNTDVQNNFEYPSNNFKILLVDTDTSSEWYYYDNGGAYPFSPSGDTEARVTRLTAQVLYAPVSDVPINITRTAAEVAYKPIYNIDIRQTRAALEVVHSLGNTPMRGIIVEYTNLS